MSYSDNDIELLDKIKKRMRECKDEMFEEEIDVYIETLINYIDEIEDNRLMMFLSSILTMNLAWKTKPTKYPGKFKPYVNIQLKVVERFK